MSPEPIGVRLERELGRPVTIAECMVEELRIERDALKADVARVTQERDAYKHDAEKATRVIGECLKLNHDDKTNLASRCHCSYQAPPIRHKGAR